MGVALRGVQDDVTNINRTQRHRGLNWRQRQLRLVRKLALCTPKVKAMGALNSRMPWNRVGHAPDEPGAPEGEEEAEDGEKEEERGGLLPPPGCRRSPISRSETGSRIGSQRLHYGLHQAF